MSRMHLWIRDTSGAAAAEFALVLPIALLFFFGIIDVGRYVWTMNQLEKAVQLGTRFAVATNVVAVGLRGSDAHYVGTVCGSKTLKAGDTICKEALDKITCTRSGCTCPPSAACPDDEAADGDAFDRILVPMKVAAPQISADDVTVSYSGSGLGYAGDPAILNGGTAIVPIVTVEVKPSFGMRALTFMGMQMPLPAFSYSQTLEDGDGTVAY